MNDKSFEFLNFEVYRQKVFKEKLTNINVKGSFLLFSLVSIW